MNNDCAGTFPVLVGFGDRGWAVASAASRPFIPTGRGEVGDPDREAFEAEFMAMGLRGQVPEAPVVILACDLNDAAAVARVARSAVAMCAPTRTYVVGVVAAPIGGDPELADGLRDLRSACHAVVLACEGEDDPALAGPKAAASALVGLCAHRGWVAIHPFDVAVALARCGYFRVGSAAGDRADIVALAELAATRAEVGGRRVENRASTNLLVHLAVSEEAGALLDLFLVVDTLSAHMSHEGEVVWAYTVRAGEACLITVLTAEQTTPEVLLEHR